MLAGGIFLSVKYEMVASVRLEMRGTEPVGASMCV